MEQEPGQRPNHEVRYAITDAEAEELLTRLADPEDDLRDRLQANPREILAEWNIRIEGIPETVTLPPPEEIKRFIDDWVGSMGGKTDNIGYAGLFLMLGAMPLVVADGDAAP